jgi:hypothetical protein
MKVSDYITDPKQKVVVEHVERCKQKIELTFEGRFVCPCGWTL